ncbi:MAG TPA: ATP-binding protein [Pyrinomonadaceae bacterium]|jgi:energy-coupling factor transporter ATP-binding protein EcfA2
MSDPDPKKFVSELLRKSKRERLEGFRGYTAKHPLLLEAYEELRCAVRDSSPGSIIFMYGPTGVGKTTILNHLKNHLEEMNLTELKNDCERFPVVTVRLSTPTSGSFDWKDYFKRTLLALEEPLVDYKLDIERWNKLYRVTHGESGWNRQLVSNDQSGIRPMRFAVEQTLRHRRPFAILIDEAQHFGVTSTGRKLLDQLNTIKSLADESQTTHVLCGTYELIPLRNLNGQLSRRSVDIHFGRYHADSKTHKQNFINALFTFQEHLPLPEIPNLVSKWDYFYERSLGCVGVLKDWLTRSLALALEDNCPTLKFKFIERRALSVSKCTTMLRETLDGEKELLEGERDQLSLREGLGLGIDTVNKEREKSSSNIEPSPNISPTQRKRRVGTRNPVRDKIGAKMA